MPNKPLKCPLKTDAEVISQPILSTTSQVCRAGKELLLLCFELYSVLLFLIAFLAVVLVRPVAVTHVATVSSLWRLDPCGSS